ncbi:MAG: YetF domain-containing protein [Acidobacteriota bacterium]
MFIEIHLAMFESSAWTNMFTLDETATWLEKILRPIIVYAALILLLRLFGKRELGQLNPFDLVVILSLSNTVQNAIIGQDNSLVGGVVGAAALLGINYSTAFVKFKSRRFESLIEGNPLKIIENSKVDENAVRRELLTKEDLDTIAHREGLDSADDIEKCVLDPNGSFLVAGNTRTSEENFRQEVLKRLEDLTHKLSEMQKQI